MKIKSKTDYNLTLQCVCVCCVCTSVPAAAGEERVGVWGAPSLCTWGPATHGSGSFSTDDDGKSLRGTDRKDAHTRDCLPRSSRMKNDESFSVFPNVPRSTWIIFGIERKQGTRGSQRPARRPRVPTPRDGRRPSHGSGLSANWKTFLPKFGGRLRSRETLEWNLFFFIQSDPFSPAL